MKKMFSRLSNGDATTEASIPRYSREKKHLFDDFLHLQRPWSRSFGAAAGQCCRRSIESSI